ncbi:MAG: sigma-70 family RNA polymerase sigma factor [Gemmataceae bacterium]
MSTRTTRTSRPVMVAVVLGTALSALGTGAVRANEISDRSINDIGRYCTTCWKNARLPADRWGDCTQEVFRRLLERVPPANWVKALKVEGDERREFLRAIDAVKKRTQRAKRHGDGVELAADPRGDGERERAEDRELVDRAARALLSDRQQQILALSFDGHTAQDIGTALAIPVERVSDEKYKAIRKLRGHFAA